VRYSIHGMRRDEACQESIKSPYDVVHLTAPSFPCTFKMSTMDFITFPATRGADRPRATVVFLHVRDHWVSLQSVDCLLPNYTGYRTNCSAVEQTHSLAGKSSPASRVDSTAGVSTNLFSRVMHLIHPRFPTALPARCHGRRTAGPLGST